MDGTPVNANRTRFAHLGSAAVAVNLLCALILAGTPSRVFAEGAPVRIVAFGDSLTAGFDLRPSSAFPAQLEKVLKGKGRNVVIENAGVSGDTTAGGLGRLAWSIPDGTDAVILQLGANDALRGIEPSATRNNLDKIITELKSRHIEILFAGMIAPANWGDGYQEKFDAIFPELAKKHEVLLYPFFLEGVVFDRKFSQSDGIHPTDKGIAEIVQRILPSVEQLVGKVESKRAIGSKS